MLMCSCIMDSRPDIYAAIAARLDSTYVREDTLHSITVIVITTTPPEMAPRMQLKVAGTTTTTRHSHPLQKEMEEEKAEYRGRGPS